MIIDTLYKIAVYAKPNGKMPFIDWLESLDKPIRYRVKERLDRIALGNFGDYKAIESGISEFRLAFGARYRIYFAQQNDNIILLLCGGDKRSQKKDIKNAIAYWHDYLGE